MISADYFQSRERFRELAEVLEMDMESHPIQATGPDGEELTIDVALSDREPSERLVISSALHGVEGFYGSAVQHALMESWRASSLPAASVVLIHALNPFGFSHLRRWNEGNIDLNRNFVVGSRDIESEEYEKLCSFINPKRPPSCLELFKLKAYWWIFRLGMSALKSAVASGQYRHPKGLFFGGTEPSETMAILEKQLPRWLTGAEHVCHIDLHTGLGPWGTYKLLFDHELDNVSRDRLGECFGEENLEFFVKGAGVAYAATGSLGQWCRHILPQTDYTCMCAEFGTYTAIDVLAGLRAENQAYQRGNSPHQLSTCRARVKELFCPADETWQRNSIAEGLKICERGIEFLQAQADGARA